MNGEPDAVALLMVVKPTRAVTSDNVYLYPDLPLLQRAFAQVPHSPMLGPSAIIAYLFSLGF